MAERTSRLEAMRRNSRADCTLRDVEALCREYGVRLQAPRSGSSHYKITHPLVREILTIPFKRPIKAVYIRNLVAFIDLVRSDP